MIDYTSLILSCSYLLALETQTILSIPVGALEECNDKTPLAPARIKKCTTASAIITPYTSKPGFLSWRFMVCKMAPVTLSENHCG